MDTVDREAAELEAERLNRDNAEVGQRYIAREREEGWQVVRLSLPSGFGAARELGTNQEPPPPAPHPNEQYQPPPSPGIRGY